MYRLSAEDTNLILKYEDSIMCVVCT